MSQATTLGGHMHFPLFYKCCLLVQLPGFATKPQSTKASGFREQFDWQNRSFLHKSPQSHPSSCSITCLPQPVGVIITFLLTKEYEHPSLQLMLHIWELHMWKTTAAEFSSILLIWIHYVHNIPTQTSWAIMWNAKIMTIACAKFLGKCCEPGSMKLIIPQFNLLLPASIGKPVP